LVGVSFRHMNIFVGAMKNLFEDMSIFVGGMAW
jgi:hypothetical protein